jgi:hypothetical protein
LRWRGGTGFALLVGVTLLRLGRTHQAIEALWAQYLDVHVVLTVAVVTGRTRYRGTLSSGAHESIRAGELKPVLGTFFTIVVLGAEIAILKHIGIKLTG